MSNELIIVLSILGVWSAVLTVLFYLLSSHYRKLTKNAKGEDLKKILEQILADEKENKKRIGQLDKHLVSLEREGKLHIQKVGLVRFNPFDETGGEHSFSLALLNDHDDGFVLTSLHTRQRTRVYIKPVKKGKSRFELSSDEQRALKEAK